MCDAHLDVRIRALCAQDAWRISASLANLAAIAAESHKIVTVDPVGTPLALAGDTFVHRAGQDTNWSAPMSAPALTFLGRIDAAIASNTAIEAAADTERIADSLARIVAGCRRRDPAAQRDLVLQTQDRVYRTLFRLVGAQDAEDVSQQVYLQVFRQISQFQGGSSFCTWLYRVTINEGMQHLRRRRGSWLSQLNSEPEDHKPNRSRQAESRELLDRALADIEPGLRSIFLLREVECLSYEEIASALGIAMGTVASRLNRARHDLQERLRRLGWDD